MEKTMATKSAEPRKKLLDRLLDALVMHMRIEEEIFYPAARKEAKEDSKIKRAKDEHDEAKELIKKLLDMDVTGSDFEPTLQKLISAVKQHVEEEEKELLPEVKETLSKDRLKELGNQMHVRFGELHLQAAPRETVRYPHRSERANP